MAGLARAFRRLLIMGAVMAGVLVTCLVAGVGMTIAVALAVGLAGLVGLVGMARQPRAAAADPPAESWDRAAASDGRDGHGARRAARATVEAMNPPAAAPVDPEALMPRWRRPSLLEARRADPTRPQTRDYTPQRFGDGRSSAAELRIVRYAVVPVLDRPDEVLGARVVDLGAGDEVHVVAEDGTFLEVICPGGERGWIHRTTVSLPTPAYLAPPRSEAAPAEAEDALSALLAARGLQ